MKKYPILIFLVIIIFSSCTPLHRLKYVQEKEQNKKSDSSKLSNYVYKLQKGDNLTVDIKTSIPEMITLFGNNNVNQNLYTSPTAVYINSLKVTDSGFIELPLLGKFLVLGKTVEQVNSEVQAKAHIYINDAVINIKLVSFNITILGEVTRPGQYVINNDRINLLEALGLAGDLNVYGNREKISIMRRNADGSYNIRYADITSKNIINQDVFILHPNDIIYVEPLKAKSWGFSSVPLATILSAVSTLILILNFIK